MPTPPDDTTPNTNLPAVPTADAPPPPADPLPPDGRSPRRRFPVPPPKIGGPDFSPHRTDAFLSEAWRDQFRPGAARVVYAAGCPGLARLCTLLAFPIYKVSTTSPHALWRRVDGVNLDGYGDVVFRDGRYVRERAGWVYFPSQIWPRQPASPGSPVEIRPRCLAIPLPDTLTPEAFDAAFNAEVARASLDVWAMSQAGRDHCATLGVNVAVAQRMTAYDGGARPLLVRAREIVPFCIYTQADRLVALCEAVILAHLGIPRTKLRDRPLDIVDID